MHILEFFKFELRELIRSPLPWLLTALFALLAFGLTASDVVQMGGGIGNVHRNAPSVIATWLTFFTLIGMLVIALFTTSALLRDFEQGTADMIFACPIRRRDYLAGRLAAALLASVFVYLLIGLGMFIAQFMPWIEPERLGPVSLAPYLWAYAVIVLPNVLFTGALLTLMAALTRSILWVYIGILGFFVLYAVSALLLKDLDNVWIAVLADPFAIRALSRTMRYWSAEERNTGLPAFAGYLFANRALWSVVALSLLATTFALFRTERAGTGGRRWGRKPVPEAAAPVVVASRPALPRLAATDVRPSSWRQLLRQAHFDTVGVLRSVPFLVLLFFGIFNFIPSGLFAQSQFGTEIYPVTSQMVIALQQSYNFLLMLIVMFYAGELVWKERGAKIDEVTDAMPVPNWVPLVGKFIALLAVIGCFQAIGVAMAIAIQLGKGFTQVEPGVYLAMMTIGTIPFVLTGCLALVIQVLCNNKFLGYAMLILVILGQSVLGMLDFAHPLYSFGQWANAPYSDMNGYGHFLPEQFWFQSYWALFLLAGMLLSAVLWVRGVGATRGQRWRLARERLRGRPGVALAATVLAFVGVGGFLFWNINIRNEYRSPDEQLDLRAGYEREFKKYASLPQPRIAAADIDVDLHPESQSMLVKGHYRIRNATAKPIADLHVAVEDDAALVELDVGEARLGRHDKEAGYRIYTLAQPLQPGEERDLRFTLDVHPGGFSGSSQETRIVDNGTFFNSGMFPTFGYQAGYEIDDRNERRKRGLGERSRMPKLEDTAARASNYVTPDADWLDFRTTICTAPDQVALAPGYLQREFVRDGRRCFRYEMDRPILNFYAYFSARWQVRKGRYKDIPIEVYYDAKHEYNVERMIEAVKESLAYYEANFSPYQHKQVRIVEFPAFGPSSNFAQSFPNTIAHSESLGFITDLRDPDEVDYVYYVTAHEIAHQWWAHQVIGGNVQGATVLSESLSQYSALMVMEKEYGREKMRRFLKLELDGYLSGRGGERLEEQPLYRNENQQYIHYQKGSLVFYRLREEMGEEAVNRALKKFIAAKAFQQAPYTTSAELLTFLRAEARPEQQALITDLFEKITFHDNRIEEATAVKRPDGKYEVTLDLHAGKLTVDGVGKETKVALDDWVEVGVFAAGPSGEERDEKVLYLQRHRITQAEPSLKVVVDELPSEAGFDPYNKLIDRVSTDNRRKVSL